MPEEIAWPEHKVEWARHHMKALGAQIQAYLAMQPFRDVVFDDPKTKKRLYGLELYPPIPRTFTFLIGDVVHNLRSALDHLVWQLVIANGETPDQGSEFPIFYDAKFIGEKAKFLRAAKRKIGKCSRAAQDAIESLQPYHGGELGTHKHPLFLTHELDIIDKHRLVAVVAGHYNVTHATRVEVKIGGKWVQARNVREAGTFTTGMVLGELGPDFETKPYFEEGTEIGIAFGDQPGIRRGKRSGASGENVDILNRLYDYIALEVLPRFPGVSP